MRIGSAVCALTHSVDTLSYNPRGQMMREQFGTTTALYHRMHYNPRGQLYDARLGTDNSTSWDGDDPTVWQYANGSWNRGALRMFYSSDLTYGNGGVNINGNLYRMDHFVPTSSDVSTWVMSVDYYGYDALNRITAITENQASNSFGESLVFTQQFTSDQYGNRTINVAGTTNLAGINRKSYTVDTATNRLGVPSGQSGTMGYDAAGNLNQDSYTTAAGGTRNYDGENRMTYAVESSGSNYYYDADGKRVRKNLGGVETWYIYGISGELVAEYPANGTATVPSKEYGYRSGQMLVVGGCDVVRWLVTDHLGTPRIELDTTGSLAGVKRHDYLPFGEELFAGIGVRSSGNGYVADCVRQQFGSKERDNETGLDYFGARYFSSVQGRFTSPDELFADQDERNPQSWNLYTYVINNPLKYDDPTGLWKRVQTDNGSIIYESDSKYDTIGSLARILNVPTDVLVGSLGGDSVHIGQQFDVTNFRDYQPPKTASEIERGVHLEMTRVAVRQLIAEKEIERAKLEIRILQLQLELEFKPTEMGVGPRWLKLGLAAKELANNVLKKWKLTKIGAGARSGQHGVPYARAATELREILKREGSGWLPEFKEEILRKIAEYEAKAGSINH